MRSKSLLLCALIAMNASAFAAPAYELKSSIGVRYEYSDNIDLLPQDGESEQILHALYNLDYKRHSGVFDTELLLGIDKQSYKRFSNRSQTAVSSKLISIATLSKERFFWDIDNRHDRIQIDQAIPNTPTNRENINYLTTGPRLYIFRDNKHALSLSVKYQNFYTQTTNTDYSGYIADLTYTRNVSRRTSIGLGSVYNNRVFNDATLKADYDRADLTLNISHDFRLSRIQLVAGHTIIKTKQGNETNGDIYAANYEYQSGEKSKFKASLRRQISDFSYRFSLGAPGEDSFTSVTNALYLLKEGRLTYIREFSYSSVKIDYSYFSNDYDNDVFDIITRTTELLFTKNLGETTFLDISGKYQDKSYPGIDRDDSAWIYLVGFRRKLGDAYGLSAYAQTIDNKSTLAAFSYKEKRFRIELNYFFN